MRQRSSCLQSPSAWLEDVLTVCDRHGWGWALWNLDGNFGIMDTDRPGGRKDCYW